MLTHHQSRLREPTNLLGCIKGAQLPIKFYRINISLNLRQSTTLNGAVIVKILRQLPTRALTIKPSLSSASSLMKVLFSYYIETHNSLALPSHIQAYIRTIKTHKLPVLKMQLKDDFSPWKMNCNDRGECFFQVNIWGNGLPCVGDCFPRDKNGRWNVEGKAKQSDDWWVLAV